VREQVRRVRVRGIGFRVCSLWKMGWALPVGPFYLFRLAFLSIWTHYSAVFSSL